MVKIYLDDRIEEYDMALLRELKGLTKDRTCGLFAGHTLAETDALCNAIQMERVRVANSAVLYTT